jgi:hypothetical protein
VAPLLERPRTGTEPALADTAIVSIPPVAAKEARSGGAADPANG